MGSGPGVFSGRSQVGRARPRSYGWQGPGAMSGALARGGMHGFGPVDITTGEHLCGGRFAARERWGNEGDDSGVVYVDVFESHIEGGQ